ncbi:MAG: hypothetical protein IPO52_12400 [Gemmatimonadetes bacterium]|nr:hypothetical protein [Gemmatimonadota bacterium]
MPARRLDPRPLLVLGEDEGTVTFGTVVGAIRLSDGSVVVADGKARELRLFEAAGRLVRTVARRGEGLATWNDSVDSFGSQGTPSFSGTFS